MKQSVDIVDNHPSRAISSTRVSTSVQKDLFTPTSCKPVQVRRWPYVVVGLLLFLIGASMSIVTLLINPGTIAAQKVFFKNDAAVSISTFSYGPELRLSQSNFFAETLLSFKEQKLSFIEADLSTMKIRYYQEGVVVFEAPILTKGKEGSWWETPAGLYSVETKSENHFSSFGKVYTPWSLAFQGNFFIHGWPYYPDGTPVSSQFSGGCIRLADVDAKALFKLADVRVPVLVYEKDYTSDGFTYNIPIPTIDAKAYLIADIESGTILAQHGETLALPIASITKLMTALVASEYINLDKDFTIQESAMASTSVPRLKPGMEMSGYSLLLPLLLESSNVAASSLAQILGTGRFVVLMNEKAKSLGMSDTRFTDASGASSGNVSSLHDLLRLATYIYNNRSFVYKISSGEKVSTAYDVYPFGVLSNFNKIDGLEGFIGGKVGKTTVAQETILSVYKMNIAGTERTIVFIALGTPDNYKAVQELYIYIQKQYGTTTL